MTLEFLKAIISWPVVVVLGLLVFRRHVASLLEGVRSLLDRIKKADLFGVSVELAEQLVNQTRPPLPTVASASDITLSVSEGAYSTDYHAIFLMAGVANRTNEPDQVVRWQLSFPSLDVELEPVAAPSNLVSGVPWWASPLVKLPAHEFIRGSLFFRGKGILAERLPEEPLHGKVVAETLQGRKLSQDLDVYRLVTLQAKAASGSA